MRGLCLRGGGMSMRARGMDLLRCRWVTRRRPGAGAEAGIEGMSGLHRIYPEWFYKSESDLA
jgi:hypothetical protein